MRRSKQAVANAERSQYVAGDIDIAKQSFGLTRQALDLNQENINFNKKMLVANTIIQGTQAAIGLTQAAVGLGNAIFENKQRNYLQAQRGNIGQVDAAYLKAIEDDFVPYDDNGKYIGFDSYVTRDGRTIGDIMSEITQGAGEHFKTQWASKLALENIKSGFVNSELKAQQMLFEREMQRRELFKANAVNDLTESFVRGEIQYDLDGNEKDILTSFRDMLSGYYSNPERLDLEAKSAAENANYERTRYVMDDLAKTKGYEAAADYLKEAFSSEKISVENERILSSRLEQISSGRMDLLNQKLNNAVEAYALSEDYTEINDIFENASGIMPEQLEAAKLKTVQQANYARTRHMVEELAETDGYNAAANYANAAYATGLIDADERKQMLAIAESGNGDRETLLDQQLIDAIDEFEKTGNRDRLDTVLEEAAHWQKPKRLEATMLGVNREANIARAREDALSLVEFGMGAVNNYLDSSNLSETRKREICAEAHNINNQVVANETTKAVERYRQALDNNQPVGAAVRSGLNTGSENTDVNENVRKEISNLQASELNDAQAKRMTGSTFMSLEQLYQAKDDLINNRGNYINLDRNYEQHIAEIDSLISQKLLQEERAASGGGLSPEAEAKSVIENVLQEFHRGSSGYNAEAAINTISAYRGISSATASAAADAIGEIMSYNIDNNGKRSYHPETRRIFTNLENTIAINAPPKPTAKSDTVEREAWLEYENNANLIRQAVYQAYGSGVRGEALEKLIDSHYRTQVSNNFTTIINRGNIGSSGLFSGVGNAVSADEGATSFVHWANRGGTDLMDSERLYDQNNPQLREALTIGGDKFRNVMNQTAERNREWANNQLRNTDVTLNEWSPANIVRDERGDPDGVIHYTGSDGRTYRVDALSERPNSRVVEVLINGQWVNALDSLRNRNQSNGRRY
ncbi:MAG: hypothetical protein LBG94_09855 [Treponema sp.]|nr:hypothetical protein [Treponema sp.]